MIERIETIEAHIRKDGGEFSWESTTGELIRCKDCKYCDTGTDEEGKPFLKCLNGRSYGGTNKDDYCSWAERKEHANK